MVRTIISLDEADKSWLGRKAAVDRVSMSEVIRRIIRRARSEEGRSAEFKRLVGITAGICSGEDGMTIQRKLRDEWERRIA